MYPSDVVSVSDLRSKTAGIFADLSRPKCVVSHNKPQAVIMSVDAYEQLMDWQAHWKTVVDFGDETKSARELLDAYETEYGAIPA